MTTRKFSSKTLLRSFFAMCLLLVAAMTNEIQAYSTERAAQIIQAHAGETGFRSVVQGGFAKGDAFRGAASTADSKLSPDEMDLAPGQLDAKLESSVENMTGDIDALISDMMSVQRQLSGESSMNGARIGILTDWIRQASMQRDAAEKIGTFQSFSKAEQEVIRLHAAATRLSSHLATSAEL